MLSFQLRIFISDIIALLVIWKSFWRLRLLILISHIYPWGKRLFYPNYFTFFKAEEIRWSSGIFLEEEFAVYCIFQRWGNINFIKWVFSKVCQIKREESQEMNGIPWTWNISVLSINFSSYVVHTMLQLASSTEITQVPKWIAQKGT